MSDSEAGQSESDGEGVLSCKVTIPVKDLIIAAASGAGDKSYIVDISAEVDHWFYGCRLYDEEGERNDLPEPSTMEFKVNDNLTVLEIFTTDECRIYDDKVEIEGETDLSTAVSSADEDGDWTVTVKIESPFECGCPGDGADVDATDKECPQMKFSTQLGLFHNGNFKKDGYITDVMFKVGSECLFGHAVILRPKGKRPRTGVFTVTVPSQFRADDVTAFLEAVYCGPSHIVELAFSSPRLLVAVSRLCDYFNSKFDLVKTNESLTKILPLVCLDDIQTFVEVLNYAKGAKMEGLLDKCEKARKILGIGERKKQACIPLYQLLCLALFDPKGDHKYSVTYRMHLFDDSGKTEEVDVQFSCHIDSDLRFISDQSQCILTCEGKAGRNFKPMTLGGCIILTNDKGALSVTLEVTSHAEYGKNVWIGDQKKGSLESVRSVAPPSKLHLFKTNLFVRGEDTDVILKTSTGDLFAHQLVLRPKDATPSQMTIEVPKRFNKYCVTTFLQAIYQPKSLMDLTFSQPGWLATIDKLCKLYEAVFEVNTVQQLLLKLLPLSKVTPSSFNRLVHHAKKNNMDGLLLQKNKSRNLTKPIFNFITAQSAQMFYCLCCGCKRAKAMLDIADVEAPRKRMKIEKSESGQPTS